MDDLIYRDKNGERLYSLQDANWNCVAVTNHDGVVQERYVYDAFGNVNGLASDWNRAFTGQVFDAETGLMLYRNRFYSTELGRFLQRDPIGYWGKTFSLYKYVTNNPAFFVDPYGLVFIAPIEVDMSIFETAKYSDGFKMCSRNFDTNSASGLQWVSLKIGNVLLQQHTYIQYGPVNEDGTPIEGVTEGWGVSTNKGDSPLDELHFDPNGCCQLIPTGEPLQHGQATGKPGNQASDVEIIDCIKNSLMRQSYKTFIYDCYDWANHTVSECGLEKDCTPPPASMPLPRNSGVETLYAFSANVRL